MTQADVLRQLHQGPRLLLLPNAWDAASARIFERAGFPALGLPARESRSRSDIPMASV